MKQLPDDNTMRSLLELAQDAEEKAKALCDFTTAIDEKWRTRLESKREAISRQDNNVKKNAAS